MYQLIEKDGSVASEVANFNAARAWAEEKGGRSVYDPNATGGGAIIYTYTANSTVFPDFQVGTYKRSASQRMKNLPGDFTLSKVSDVDPILVKSGVDDEGFPANPTMGQTVVIDGDIWKFGADGQWAVGGGTGTTQGNVPTNPDGSLIDTSNWGPDDWTDWVAGRDVEWPIDPTSGLAINPLMEGATSKKPDGSEWKMTGGQWNLVKAATGTGGGQLSSTYEGIDFTAPDFMKLWADQIMKGKIKSITTEYLDGLLTQWALANNENPSGAYNALFSETGNEIFDHPKFGAWASGVRDESPTDIAAMPSLSQSQVLDSATRGGRRELFNRYRATQGLGGKTQRALDLFNQKFDPASARFALDNILEGRFMAPPEGGFSAINPDLIPESRMDTNFRSFLANPNAARPLDPAGFQERFSRIEPWFNTPEEQMSVTDLARKRALSGPNVDNAMVFNIIKQALGAEVNPFLRGGIGDILANRVAAFRDVNTETPLFEEFVNRGFTF